jgi:hypothetical protein
MRQRAALSLLLIASVCLLHPFALAGTKSGTDEEDEAIVKKAGVRGDSESLVQFLRRRSLNEAKRSEVRGWVRDLGSARFTTRQKATRQLLALGPPVLPYLQQALTNPDVEVVSRARRCLDQIRHGPGPELPAAVVRLLVQRRPNRTIETLLSYLPSAESEAVAEEVVGGLERLTERAGNIDPALRAALRDRATARRGAAAYVLGRRGGAADRAEVRRVLRDPDPQVRLEAAHGLTAGGDKGAVPVLLALIKEGPELVAGQADDVLRRIAGETAPDIFFAGKDVEGRRSTALAWDNWWQRYGHKIDWRRVDIGFLGGALVAELETNNIWEAGPGGRPRRDREVDELGGPYDVQALTGGRLLVAEYLAQRVTERDRKGAILWQIKIADPIACRRLPNGNTFIATNRRVVEFRPDAKEAFSYALKEDEIPAVAAYRPLDSSSVYVACQQGLFILDTAHTPVTAKKLAWDTTVSDIQPGSGGRLLLTTASGLKTKVLEVDSAGRSVKEWTIPAAGAATRLANGHILAASSTSRRLFEVDLRGKVVWRKHTEGRPIRVRRR